MIHTRVWIVLIILIGTIGVSNTNLFAQTSPVTILELNTSKEYLLIKNEGETAINLHGWTLHDHDYGKANVFSYTFTDVTLQPGEILQMQSGKKPKNEKDDEKEYKLEESTYYIRWSDRNVWNNDCDIAYILNAQGNLIAEKQYGYDIEKGKKESCK